MFVFLPIFITGKLLNNTASLCEQIFFNPPSPNDVFSILLIYSG